jgi:endonuclease III
VKLGRIFPDFALSFLFPFSPRTCYNKTRIMSKVERICDLLDACYGRRELQPHNPPLDELVLTILSQNTNSRNCAQAFDGLRRRFPSWDEVLSAGEREIAEAIHVGGLSTIKAGRIKSILREIADAQGRLDLSWLAGEDTQKALDYLLAFHGVGRKTAACVLLFSLGRPVLPVDTHVHRVSIRLGLIGPKVSAEEAHDLLQRSVPEDRIYSFHVNMISHGRAVCVAGTPKCDICTLTEVCDYFARTRAAR